MKTNRNILQLTLISIGLFLILATYFLYPKIKEKKFENELARDNVIDTQKDKANTFENVEYKGYYNIDNPFIVRSKDAYVESDDPNIIYMSNMHVILYMDDGRTINITSDKGRYNKLTYDCFFEKNVKAKDEETIILADYLDLLSTTNSATVYDNVILTTTKGSLRADKVNYDFETKFYKISMLSDKKVKVKIIKWVTLKNLESLNLSPNPY